MTVTSIVGYIGEVNIAGNLEAKKLSSIADDVIERFDQDDQSMKDWMDGVNNGIELCKPEYSPKSEPWPGAANFKSTILAEASNTFGNRGSIEIMRDPKLVKTTITGLATIKNVIDKKAAEVNRWKDQVAAITESLKELDPNDPEVKEMQDTAEKITQKIDENMQIIKKKKEDIRRKNERADRVNELMNWQVNVEMEEWRQDMKRILYSLPNPGSMFKKTYYDPTMGRPVSETINYPDFRINQKTKSMKTCRSFTHIIAFSKAEADLRVKLGIWVNEDLYPRDDDGDAGSNEKENAAITSDNDKKFYEQYCWLDLDDDGVEEPYIVTVHVSTCKVVRIVARYDEDTVIVKSNGIKPMSLLSAQKKRKAMIEAENAEYLTKTPIPEPDDLTGFDIVRIEPLKIVTKYGMIPSFDGTFLDVGFYHLIGSMTLGHNKTTNDLLNGGTLATNNGGMVAKGFRRKAGGLTVKPNVYIQTECSPETLQASIAHLPYKEPSQTLFMLNEKLENSARSFSANSDAGSQIQANTAPTTALAMLQESMIPHTAHMSMVIDSMSEEFGVLFQLNRAHLDSDKYKEIVGDDEAVFADDFNTDGLSVTCGANPEMSSKMQRMMLAQAELEQIDRVIQAGGNPLPIIKNYYKRIGSENLDEIFPNEAEMSPEEKAQMKAMQQQQEYANKLAEQQVQLMALQSELLKKGEERKDFEAKVSATETNAKIDKMLEEIENIKAGTLLKREQAETEQTKNKINVYTAHADITAENERLRIESDKHEHEKEMSENERSNEE
jgi:hypothetical protein